MKKRASNLVYRKLYDKLPDQLQILLMNRHYKLIDKKDIHLAYNYFLIIPKTATGLTYDLTLRLLWRKHVFMVNEVVNLLQGKSINDVTSQLLPKEYWQEDDVLTYEYILNWVPWDTYDTQIRNCHGSLNRSLSVNAQSWYYKKDSPFKASEM